MILTSVTITNFKSIINSGNVSIDFDTTVLVGQNESGKSAFLQALYQVRPIFGIDKGFDKTIDYPRKNLRKFHALHPKGDAIIARLTYRFRASDLDNINKFYGLTVIKQGNIIIDEHYNEKVTISGLQSLVDEKSYIKHLLKNIILIEPVDDAVKKINSIQELMKYLTNIKSSDSATALLTSLNNRFSKSHWADVLALEIYQKFIIKLRPKFFYFDEYRLLPGKANLKHLQTRVLESNDEIEPKPLTSEEEVVLALLQMAEISLDNLLESKSYEEAVANLEGVSNSITDQFLSFWLQNPNLEVIIDIDEDPKEEPPFNEGPNIYVRIRNKQHRTTLPFNQRSKGFIWFFSFLVWFNNIHTSAAKRGIGDAPVILLLDEPGLNLHALAQSNLLAYIDFLAQDYQIIYTTHSPFMVRSERLSQVRVVEDKEPDGTKISDRLDDSDPKTLFPLQAALGYTVAQSLFISTRNLLVEGIADLAYLQFFSQACEAVGKEGLRTDITIMPVGGIDKIATFVSLLGANKLELVIMHDYNGRPEAKLESLVMEKILHEKHLLTYAAYREPTGKKPTKAEQEAFIETDVEDLLTINFYLKLFCETFSQALKGRQLTEADLPPGIRIVERLNRWLDTNKIKTRPSGGFNHYAPAKNLLTSSIPYDNDTIGRFSAMFREINKLFK